MPGTSVSAPPAASAGFVFACQPATAVYERQRLAELAAVHGITVRGSLNSAAPGGCEPLGPVTSIVSTVMSYFHSFAVFPERSKRMLHDFGSVSVPICSKRPNRSSIR